jgi:23S rRNA pseudouridine2605 synthase
VTASERVQKVLARVGIGSRRAVEELIVQGRVAVNGAPAELGRRIDPEKDQVEVDGSPVPLRSTLVAYLFNKPPGVVTTAQDPEGRPTVADLVDVPQRVWPVGRLDVGTEGALILTNDGDLTHRLTHPRHGVAKTYVAKVRGEISSRALQRLRSGVRLEDGDTRPARARLLRRARGSSLVEVILTEGRNRQVRRMLEAVGYPVQQLVRTAVGPVALGRLRSGTLRRLSPQELRALYAGEEQVDKSPRPRRDKSTNRSSNRRTKRHVVE